VPGTLVICSTPIGNLSDAPPRLAEALATADVVFAEDTRRSRILLDALGVSTPLRSYFLGNERTRSEELVERLASGDTVALVSDAGTPVVSDPGAHAVAMAREIGARVTTIPGPSAVTSAVAVSGMTGDRFVFEGFLPRKGRDRSERLEELAQEPRTMVLFCAPHRLGDDLTDLAEALGEGRPVCVVRELTKMHEEVVWSTLGEAAGAADNPRGEYTLVIEGAPPQAPDIDAAIEEARSLVVGGMSVSAAARQVAERRKVSRRSVYEALVVD